MNQLFKALFIVVFFAPQFLTAQNKWRKQKIEIPPTICFASDKLEKSYVPPPKEFLLKSGDEKKSEIIVEYSLFPDEAKVAFEYAVSIWESIIESDIPIHIQANWRSQDKNVLGSAGPAGYYSNFENAPRKNRFYPVAIAEKITNTEINSTSLPDIDATFNKDVKWYFGTDSETPDELYNFVTVVLHEIGHGLGFTGFFYISGNKGSYANENLGDASAFDIMVMNSSGQFLTDTNTFALLSQKLNDELISGSLYADSPVAISDNTGYQPRLYVPSTWSDGSSIYHLNDATYPYTTENSLMTHAIGKGETVHDPGPVTRGILADIGWKHMVLDLDKPKDIEEIKPIVFNLNVKSDFELDTASLFVYYSYNLLKGRIDSLPFILSESGYDYTAKLNPSVETGNVYYYISASDKKNRKFFLPTEAPNEYDTITIGPDTEAPVINHTPVPYVILPGEAITLSAQADDNLGVDTVFIEYSVNGIPQNPFGLNYINGNFYSGNFNLNLESLKDGDEIAYKIVAIDSSQAKNLTRLPRDSVYTFKIERIFDPIGSYFNDFNYITPDFIIADFDVYRETGFENGSLNSPHPYSSPNKDNTTLDFSTMLKYPIILNENSTMSFDEIVLVEPGEVLSVYGDEDFWDYVIVEGSKDKGKTWLPVSDGYDSGLNSTWKTNYNNNVEGQVSNTVGIPDWYVNHEINILENGNFKAGDTLLFRFRLFSDPYAHGWGWAIDNLRIQQPVSAPVTVLSPGNIRVYPNPFNNKITVSIQAKNMVDKVSYDVFNLYGQKITGSAIQNVYGEIKQEIDLSAFSSGMYFLSVKENGHKIYSKKIVKN